MIPATIPYIGAVALAKAVGVSTAGLSAMEISNAITQRIQENPEVLNTPQAKGIAFAMGIKLPGVFAPDAEEMERERQRIEQDLKPGVTKPIDQGPIKTGETTPPKIETTEILPIAKEVGPIKEQFPSEADKVNIPIITYSKGSPKDLKDLVERSVGQEKGNKAIEKIYDDSIFDGVLETSELNRMRQLEQNYTGGLNDLGDAGIPVILENTMLDQHEEYMEDYKDALANAARETLGNEFKAYRLMEKEDAIKMLTEGEFPNIKRLQEDEEGNEVYKDIIVDMMGQETPLSREAFSFSLSPKEALSFRYLSAGDRRSKKDEDFVLIEMKASPTDIVMRGHESEKDLVLRVDGNVAGDRIVTPNLFNIYDVSFGDGNKVELSENELFKNFVEEAALKRAESKKTKKEDPTSNLYKTVNKAQHRFLLDSISEYTENISKGTTDKVNKLLYLNEKVTFTDKQLRELKIAIGDKRQLDFDLANKKNWDDVDEDLDLSIKENAEMLNTVTDQEYLDLFQKLKTSKKILKKAYGGFIDKPLTGGSRYI